MSEGKRLTFSPALPCADCKKAVLTTQGLIYAAGSGTWQLVPFCPDHLHKALLTSPPVTPLDAMVLRRHIDKQLTRLDRLQHQQVQLKRALTRLRRRHASLPARHALRRRLHGVCRQLQAQARDREARA